MSGSGIIQIHDSLHTNRGTLCNVEWTAGASMDIDLVAFFKRIERIGTLLRCTDSFWLSFNSVWNSVVFCAGQYISVITNWSHTTTTTTTYRWLWCWIYLCQYQLKAEQNKQLYLNEGCQPSPMSLCWHLISNSFARILYCITEWHEKTRRSHTIPWQSTHEIACGQFSWKRCDIDGT